MPRRVTILHHDNCFDGCASSAVFTQLYKEKIHADSTFKYRGVHHRIGNPFESRWFDGDENVVLDFRYTSEPKLTWWIDHHITTFSSEEDEAQFKADSSGKKFFDPQARSCTKLIARIGREKFGWDSSGLNDLIEWADLIDGAQFKSAKEAVELEAPALKLMTVIEANRQNDFLPKIIEAFTTQSIDEIAARRDVQKRWKKLHERHEKAIEMMRKCAKMNGSVAFYDVADQDLFSINKFIIYYLLPQCRYTVGVSQTASRSKVSVGSNPWNNDGLTQNLGRICERYGGGGHAVVGAVTLGPNELEKAREYASAIVAELQTD